MVKTEVETTLEKLYGDLYRTYISRNRDDFEKIKKTILDMHRPYNKNEKLTHDHSVIWYYINKVKDFEF